MSKRETYVDRIIRKVGGLRRLAKALGHKNPSTVTGWRQRGRIPDWQKPKVMAAAKACGVEIRPEEFFPA